MFDVGRSMFDVCPFLFIIKMKQDAMSTMGRYFVLNFCFYYIFMYHKY